MNAQDLLDLYDLPLPELAARADAIRRAHTGQALDLCTIANAKSGRCGEDCAFCAQSAHWATTAPVYGLMGKAELLECARRAEDLGSSRLGIVTSGHRLAPHEVTVVAEAVADIRSKTGIAVCASLGSLEAAELAVLKQAGLSRFHHNLETSRAYFPSIVTTHTYDERIRTVTAAAQAGLSTCSGGIIGLGETRRDRIDLALTLKALDVDSIPINILAPIAGTPLALSEPISVAEALKTVAIFRLVLPGKTIRLAAGREGRLKDFQGMAFMAGANGMLIGGYLTLAGRDAGDDNRLVREILTAWNQ